MRRFLVPTQTRGGEFPPQLHNKSIDEAGPSSIKNPCYVDIETSRSSIDSPDETERDPEKAQKKCSDVPDKTIWHRKSKQSNQQAILVDSSDESRLLSSINSDNVHKHERPHKRRRLAVISENSCLSDGHDETTDYTGDSVDSVDLDKATRKTKKNYKQKFKNDWKAGFAWLDSSLSKPYCKVCLKAINGGITHLRRHDATTVHQKNMEKTKKTLEIQTYFDADKQKVQNLVKAAELKMTMFLHEHNLPFSLMDHLPKLITSVCPDSKIAKSVQCGRTKATNLTKDCIATEQIEQIAEKLKKNVFSIIIDETTDISTEKSLAIVVRFYDNEQCKDRFLGLVKVKSCTAEDLFQTICKYFEEHDVPIANMIGLAADNASVMMGSISGVQARFKEIIPTLFVLGCVCHSFHLCSSAAAKKLPRSVEDLIRGIYNYFSHSSNRQSRLQEFQCFIELKPHKLLHPCQTRWLSLQAAVDRVVENWDALILFFTHECFEDNLSSTQTILAHLKNPIYKIYFTFLVYILDSVNRLNLEFQAEKPKLHLLLSRVQDLYRNILRNFVKKDHLDKAPIKSVVPDNPKNFVLLDKVYFGAKTEILLTNENINPHELHNFRTQALSFYIVLAEQIRKRFNFDDPVLSFVSYFDPKTALSGEISSIALHAFKFFPQLVDDIEKLNSEWRLLPDIHELKAHKDEPIEEFWMNIFKSKNQLNVSMFPHLTKLVKGLLCLPHSSAAAERVFSQLNLMKTKTRNKLHIDTCDSIMHAKELLSGDTCYSFEPSFSLLKRKPRYA